MSFEKFQEKLSANNSKNLPNSIQPENNNSSGELLTQESTLENPVENKPVPNPPIKKDSVYDVFNPSRYDYKGITLESASNNSIDSGKYIDSEGKVSNLDLSGFKTVDGKLFGANGLVYVKSGYGKSTDDLVGLLDGTPLQGTIAEYIGKAATSWVDKYDPNTQLRMLVPGINPENGQPILKEVIGTRKEFSDKKIAMSQAYGFQNESDGILASFGKGLLNTLNESDEVVVGAMRMLNPVNSGLDIWHQQAIEKNKTFSYLPSEESSKSFTWDWFSQGLGAAMGSQIQFGATGRIAGFATKQALRLGGQKVFQSYAKRKFAENVASWGASAVVGTGHAMSEAKKAGLNDMDSWLYAATVGGINAVIEKKLNVDFDKALMGGSTQFVTRNLLKELNGDFSQEQMNKAAKIVLSSALGGGKAMLKAAATEGVEEILQTGVEQTSRMIHDAFQSSEKHRGKGRFESSDFNVNEILESGFFGMMASFPMQARISISSSLNNESYVDRMIREGKGQMVLAGIDDLFSQAKISEEKYRTIKAEARIKIESFENNKEAFFNLKGFSNQRLLQRDLHDLFKNKSLLKMQQEKLLSKLAGEEGMSPEAMKKQADQVKKELSKIDKKLTENQEKIDAYKNREFVASENTRYEKSQANEIEESNSVFELLTRPEQALGSFEEILDRYNNLSEEELGNTLLFRNATEARMVVEAIQNGNAAKILEDQTDPFLELVRENLIQSKMYLHPSVNTDNNRAALLEMGLDENNLPLTASEKKRAENNPEEFKGRFISTDDFNNIVNGNELKEAVDKRVIEEIGDVLETLPETERAAFTWMELVQNGTKYGITHAMLHNMNETDSFLDLLGESGYQTALSEMISKTDKPNTLLSSNAETGKSAGFHHAFSGTVLVAFNKARMQELRAKELAGTLTTKEKDELSVSRKDLFHKLVHEQTHNLFDYELTRLSFFHSQYKKSGNKTPEAMLYARLLDLAKTSYYALEKNPKARELYFIKTVARPYFQGRNQFSDSHSAQLVKEFFAEAMSNPAFQELLDGVDLGSAKTKKLLEKHYPYKLSEGGFVKSLLKEIVEAFNGVVSSIYRTISKENNSLLTEAMILGSKVSTNQNGLISIDKIPFIGNMDISMYNPKLLIDNEDEFIDKSQLAFSISQRLADEGFLMTDKQYADFSKKMGEYVAESITSEIESRSLKVVYFKVTDSFLITYKNAEGKVQRQFFNRYGNKESLNTNVFNSEKGSNLKKPYAFDKTFSPLNDNDKIAGQNREVVNNYLAAIAEGFDGETTLSLNEDKLFGGVSEQYRGEIEILYTYKDGTKAVIGYAPDLAKPRLARMLSLGATIPVKMQLEGTGSKAFVLYNVAGDSNSGVKRIANPKDHGGNMTESMIKEGYVKVDNFLPRTLFFYDVDNIQVEASVVELANAQDSFTVQDEALEIDWSSVKALTDQNLVRNEYDINVFNEVLGEGFSFYMDLDLRNKNDQRAWLYRDKIRKEIAYRAMTGLYNKEKLRHVASGLAAMAKNEFLAQEELTAIEVERAARLGFQTESEFVDFINDLFSANAMDSYAEQASSGIKQDWDGHGLNPNDTVFAMVRAQLETLVYMNPITGRKELVTMDKAREVLFVASRESSSFNEMIGKLLGMQKDPKLDQTQKEIAKSIYNYYSAPSIDSKLITRLAAETSLPERLFVEIAEAAASKATGSDSFRAAIRVIQDSGSIIYPDGSSSSFSKDQIQKAGESLTEHYSGPHASYNGLVRYFGSNSLFTAFASLRKVDSVSLIPTSDGNSILSFNGKTKVKDEIIADNELKIKRVLNEISSQEPLSNKARQLFYQRVVEKYQELGYGEFPKAIFVKNGEIMLDKFLYFNQFFGEAGKLSNLKGQGINDKWMQDMDSQNYKDMARVLKAFFLVFDIDIPNGVFMRYQKRDAEYYNQFEQTANLEFLEKMSEKEIFEGSPEYATELNAHKANLAKVVERLKTDKYNYPLSKFGRNRNKNTGDKDFGSHPMFALVLQSAYFLNTSMGTYFSGEKDTEIMGDEMKKLSEEQIMFGRVNQSDEMYFDPKGNKRFSVKIKSQADTLMEELSMDKDGVLSELIKSPEWENNTVLKKIQKEKGRPIDVMISGLRTWRKGTVYSESTDLDFVYLNMASFTSRYDYSDEYIHVDDIPSDKPTIYGYRLERLEKGQIDEEIENLINSERKKIIAAKQLAKDAFTQPFFQKKGKGAEISNQDVFDTLVEGIHYKEVNGRFYPGKIFDSKNTYFKGNKSVRSIRNEIKSEASKLYAALVKQGIKIPLNSTFIKENDPRVILDGLNKTRFRLQNNLKMYPSSANAQKWSNELVEINKQIPAKEKSLSNDLVAYNQKADSRREELFVEEFYPNYVVNRYHLSRLLMGDSVFYKNVSDMNKRKAGPAAPFYKGSWRRKTASLVALNDVADFADITLVNLPSVTFDEETQKWKIEDAANEVETKRTDAQGYVTEQFAQEMVDAYGAFSGFKKIFKPVMFGVNRKFLKRGQPLYMKLSVSIILDPNDEKNAEFYNKFPNQRAFAEKFYESKGDLALFKSGIKVGFKNNSKVEDSSYKTQPFDLNKFGLQNDPEKSVEDDDSEIAGGVQLHKQLADNDNFEAMLPYYALESQILREKSDKAFDSGTVSSLESIRSEFIEQLKSKTHTSELGVWMEQQSLDIMNHPFSSEAVQNMTQSVINKLGTLLKKKGKKFVNLSDLGFERMMPTQNDIDKTRLFIERGLYRSDFENKEYVPKWAGPRREQDLHRLDESQFKKKTEEGTWKIDESTGYITDKNGKPVIFPADVLVPVNSNIPLGNRLINTRIPTTGKSSNIPSRVIGYLPIELGNVIVTPKEGPGILGFDFDVDGLFAWTDQSGDKQMDYLFAIAYGVLSDAKNYNELTSPVGTDMLKSTANFFSVDEKTAEEAYRNGEEIKEGEMNPNGWLDYGFARQLEMMKMNAIGKVFIGASASFSAIYSVFAQTGVRLQSSEKTFRRHGVPGAKEGYPQKDQNGNRITDVFVQLINAATDNVKEMLLSRNNVNLITGNVFMDLIAHGVSLDYSLLFINQPIVRDLVRLNDRYDSASIDQDYLKPEDRLQKIYTDLIKGFDLGGQKYKYENRIFRENATADTIEISEDKLREMYFAGNKKMTIGDVNTMEDLVAFFGNKINPNEDLKGQLLQLMENQLHILEKFKFYKQLASVTRNGGSLVMMFSKNPKNFNELKAISDKINDVYFSESPKLSTEVINHPSYNFQLNLINKTIGFYEKNLLVANRTLNEEVFDPIYQNIGMHHADRVQEEFMNSIVLKSLISNGINSSLLTGSFLTSLEFNEIFVRLLHDNRELFQDNKFMQQLTFELSDLDLSDLEKAKGKISTISFNGTKQFSQVELEEIQDDFSFIPKVEYEGRQVDLQSALIYYLAITKGFKLGGYSFSKILPQPNENGNTVFDLINDVIVGFKQELEIAENEIYDSVLQEELEFNSDTQNVNTIDILAEKLDPYLLTSLKDFGTKFNLRNDQIKSEISRDDFYQMVTGNSSHFDTWAAKESDPNATYVGAVKVKNVNKKMQFSFAAYNTNNPDYSSFIKNSVRNSGFILIDKNGDKKVFTFKERVQRTVDKGVFVEYLFEEKGNATIPGLYEPSYFESKSTVRYQSKKVNGLTVDISRSPIHENEKNPNKLAFFEKDKKKFKPTTKLIARGSENSSSNSYAIAAGPEVSNTGIYTDKDIVGISAEGNRKDRIGPDFAEISLAINAGAKIITDGGIDRNRPYNTGEREVADFLSQNGYIETKNGLWEKDQAFIPWKDRVVMVDETGFGLAESIENQSVIVSQDKDVKNFLEASGFIATKLNPDVYYFKSRDPHSYNEEQLKTLRNKC